MECGFKMSYRQNTKKICILCDWESFVQSLIGIQFDTLMIHLNFDCQICVYLEFINTSEGEPIYFIFCKISHIFNIRYMHEIVKNQQMSHLLMKPNDTNFSPKNEQIVSNKHLFEENKTNAANFCLMNNFMVLFD